MAHKIRTVNDAIHVSHHGSGVHINVAMHARTGADFITSTVIVEPATARALAAALVEMADAAEAFAAEASKPVSA